MKKSILVFFILLLTFSLIMSTAYAKSMIRVPELNKSFTGEEIYRGIIFGQGEVARLFPELWTKEKLELANTSEAIETVNYYMEKIKEKDNSFFENVKKYVNSRNPYAIDNIFKRGTEHVIEILEEQGNLVSDPNEFIGINTVVIWGIAVGVIIGAWGFAYYHSVLVTDVTVTFSDDSIENNFSKEVLINNMVERLSNR